MGINHAWLESEGLSVAAYEQDIRKGNANSVEILINMANFSPDEIPESSEVPLSLACACGNLDVVKMLVAYGADIDARWRGDVFPPLLEAAKNGHCHVVSWLLGNGADPNCYTELMDNAGNIETSDSPLTAALQNGNLGIAEMLLDAGASLDATSIRGFYSPLGNLISVTTHPLAMIIDSESEYLLQKSLKLMSNTLSVTQFELNTFSVTPLEYALKKEKLFALPILLSAGCSANIFSEYLEFSFPIEYAAKKGMQEAVELLFNFTNLYSPDEEGTPLFKRLCAADPSLAHKIVELL